MKAGQASQPMEEEQPYSQNQSDGQLGLEVHMLLYFQS